ncbi:MAG: TIGR02099 family protein, partial [Gammaproteobacteria bacterium]|nr:TIGR02099 family protein [Gammaproteobacteria bacterium]
TRVVARASGGALARFDRIAGHLQLTHAGNRWTLAGQRVQAQRDGRTDPPSRFEVTWRGIHGGGLDLRAHASYLRADNLLPLAALLPQNSTRARLIALAPTGEWRDASLSLERANSRAPWHFRVRARFHNAGFAAFGRSPGVHGLSGVLEGDQNAGHVAFASRSLIVDWPAEWPRPVGFDSLDGTVYWSRTPTGLLIATPRVEIDNADGRLAVLAAVRVPGAGRSPRLDLVARLRDGKLADASVYLPRATLHPKPLAWLDQAFLAGRVPSGEIVFRGPVRHFPFRDGSGAFLARLQVAGAALRFARGWPALRDVAAEVRFRDQGLRVHVEHATVDHLAVSGARVRIADFRDAVLTARAGTSSDAATVLQFLRDSPINVLAHGGFTAWRATGPIEARVHLRFPFKDFAHRRVVVKARLRRVTLGRRGVPDTASGLSGDLTVNGSRVPQAHLAGRLLGGPVTIVARPPRARAHGTWLDFAGVAQGAALAAAIGLPPAGHLIGSAAWHARLTILDAPARERRLRVSSDLDGLGIELPAPLDKPADRSLPSWIEVRWPRASAPRIDFALGSIARGALEWHASAAGEQFARAAIGFGGEPARFGPDEALDLGGRIDRVDLRGWSRFLPRGRRGAALPPVRIGAHLRIGEADYAALAVRDLDLGLAASGEGWRVTFGGPGTDGRLRIPAGGARTPPWEFDFSKIDVIEPTAGRGAPGSHAAPPHVDPASLPAARVRVGRLTWAGRRLGAVQARVSAVADGLILDDLTFAGRSFTAHLRGDWRGAGTGSGHLVGTLASGNVEETMADLGYARVIAGKTGRVDVDLRWTGVPTVDAFREATGRVKIALVNGQVFGIKPGAGRVLGLASVAALPRRLALDFSDVTDKGLAFDRVDGTFALRGGNAYTNDVLLKGPAAQIGVVGRIGLKAQDYDQIAVVTNRVGSTLPLAGALAGGPVVGAAVLLFTEVFKQPLQGLERGYYRISGSWENPKVQRIDHAAAAAAIAKDGKP